MRYPHFPLLFCLGLLSFVQAAMPPAPSADQPDATGADASAIPLWAGSRNPAEKHKLPLYPSRLTTINTGTEGQFQFTLGADIIFHDGEFFAQWAASAVDENDAETLVQFRRSSDAVRWSPAETLAPGFEGPGYHSHGVFLAENGNLWSFNPQIDQSETPKGRYKGLKMDRFSWDKAAGTWQAHGSVLDNFWPLMRPLKLENGNWLIPGVRQEGKVAVAAVALSEGDDLGKWKCVPIPHPDGYQTDASKFTWGETAVFADGNQLVAIVRDPSGKNALCAISTDNGETWSQLAPTNFPMANSKPTAGTLPDGRHYLVYNMPTRDSLLIAFADPGATQFTRAYRLIDQKSHLPRHPGDGKKPQWAYPNATVVDEHLYIVYSVSKEDTGLCVIDLKKLPSVARAQP